MKPIRAYRSIFLHILKLILAAGILGFIGYKLIYAYHISDLWAHFQFNLTVYSATLLVFTLLLMPLNWHLEVVKWKVIIRKHEPASTFKAYKSILSGITLGIVTPNQIGSLAGKAVYLDQLPKVKGAVATLLGDLAQTFAAVIIGSYGLLGLYFHMNPTSDVNPVPAFILLTLINAGVAWLFLHIHLLQRFDRWKWLTPYIAIGTDYSRSELTQLLILSGLRFLLFTSQYYVLLFVFGINLTPAEWAMSVLSIYTVISFAPSFIMIQLGIRGALALYFVGLFTGNTVGVLLSTYSLWIINLMIPGLIGLYFLLTHKWSSRS